MKRTFFVCFLFLILLSHLLKSILDLPVSVGVLFSPVILVFLLIFYKKVPRLDVFLFFYFYLAYFLLLSFFSVLESGEIKHLIQVASFTTFPLACVILGYNASEMVIRRSLLIFFVLLLVFVILERISHFASIDILGVRELSLSLQDSDSPVLGRAVGLYGNPNELGFVAGLLFFVMVYLGVRIGVAFSLSVVLIFLSASRGSLVAFILALSFFVMINPRNSNKLVMVLFTLVFLAVLGQSLEFLNFETNLARFFEVLSILDSRNFQGRVDYWESVVSLESPVLGTWIPPQLYFGHAIDNAYLYIFAQGGILGLLVFSLFFLFLVVFCFKEFDKNRKAISLSLLIFVSVNSITMLGLLGAGVGGIFWLYLGVFFRRFWCLSGGFRRARYF